MAMIWLLTVLVPLFTVPSSTDSSTLNITFQRSLSLSRKILQDVRDLLIKYKHEKMGNPAFEDHNMILCTLPQTSLAYSYWVQMQDVERLMLNAKDLYIFWIHVDFKRIDELGDCQESVMSKSMEMVSLDLRDLIAHLSSQISALNSTSPEPSDLTLPNNILNPDYDWHSKLQGYIIFRDLETYLNKVVRDFTLLKTKYRE
ncbi:cardiotrophin-2 [Scyliorhinus canicula]|uniref:cardiotrophin-2 n=1 Tax=Scyliorhinus canicula TaxID=7830 RepID=UPI0018F34C74|nr:cardiotrophin-2 [Scyliorhinus canicula]